jgi:hypothetical protein
MAAPYLSSKTEVLSSQKPVEPSQARAAQIPLQNFSLPTFPPEAFSSGMSLFLSSLSPTIQFHFPFSQTSLLHSYLRSHNTPELPTSLTSAQA